MSYLTIAKPAFGTLEGFQKLMSAREIGQGEPDGLQARYVADVGDGIRVVAVWESMSLGSKRRRWPHLM